VCGLDVIVDPRRPSGIVVEPGYARSCCGDDLVLCEPFCLELARFCREPCDPCLNAAAGKDDEPCHIGGFRVPRRDLVALDILLEPARGAAGSKDGCSNGGASGDGFGTTVLVRAVPAPEAAARHDWEAFEAAWKDCVADPPPKTWRPRHFPWAGAEPEQAFWRMLDCRLSLLAAPCATCTEDDALRLGRVWLRRGKDDGGRPCCHVILIAVWSPWRQRWRHDMGSAPPGEVNLARLALGRPLDAARLALRQAGLGTWRDTPWERIEAGNGGLEKARAMPAFAPAGAGGTLWWYTSEAFGIEQQVVGWALAEGRTR
jgi:hypothetical protein